VSDFHLRTESIKYSDILDLSVLSESDQHIIEALKSPEPCLIEGSRGTGKSFLMRVAEQQLQKEKDSLLAVYITFTESSLISSNDPLQFYHWMLAKTIKALTRQLRKNGLQISAYSAELLSNDESSEGEGVEHNLKEIVNAYEASYKGTSLIDTDTLPDIEDVREAVESICEENKIERIYLFFDEAAHVFRPEQQRQFFSLFKDLRSPYITCNAAIYPGVTYFGNSFELIHDCIFKKIERDIRDQEYLDYFFHIVLKQSPENLKTSINSNMELFNTLALSCGGNPRMLLRTIQDLPKFNTSSVNQLLKSYYRSQIWVEHTELGEKFKGHKQIVDWGRDFLETQVIPSIEAYNTARQLSERGETSIYFWIHKDSPETVKEALRLLTYTGIIRKIDSAYRATRSQLGSRYEVKYGCMIAMHKSPTSSSKEFFDYLSIKKFPEFGKNHPAYSEVKDIVSIEFNEELYRASLMDMLQKPIEVLHLLTDWQKQNLEEVGIHTVEDLHNISEEHLISAIDHVGPIRARYMKNAAAAEVLEYLSG